MGSDWEWPGREALEDPEDLEGTLNASTSLRVLLKVFVIVKALVDSNLSDLDSDINVRPTPDVEESRRHL